MIVEPTTFIIPAGKATIVSPNGEPIDIDFPDGGKMTVVPDAKSLGTGNFENPDMVGVLERLFASLNIEVALIHRGGQKYEIFTRPSQAAKVQITLGALGELVKLSRATP